MKEKLCGKCNLIKSVDDFGTHRDTKDGFQTWCKNCRLDNAKANRLKRKDPNYSKERKSPYCPRCDYRNLKYGSNGWCLECLRAQKHGVSYDDVENLLLYQNYSCALCLNPLLDDFHIDHDHNCCPGPRSCGKCIRGFLHVKCNLSLGNFNDDAVLLRRAAEYIERNTVNV